MLQRALLVINFFLLFLIFYSSNLFAQEKIDFDNSLRLSFYKNIKVPHSITDSCEGTIVLLDFYIDENYNILNIRFSDNANQDLKSELKKKENKLDTKSLVIYSQRNKINNIHFIYPVIFILNKESCLNTKNLINNPMRLITNFDGELLTYPALIREPITITISDVVH